MNHDDERDYDEERANQLDMEREHEEEAEWPVVLPAGMPGSAWLGGQAYACCLSQVGNACAHRRVTETGEVVVSDEAVRQLRRALSFPTW